jgi:xanthine dehydrogenase accessory factor
MYKTILDRTLAGEDTMLISVIARRGSGPRSAGACMLAGRGGRISGTIGGGALEYQALQLGGELLELRESQVKTYSLRQDGGDGLGMLCGGDVEVFFRFIRGGDGKIAALMEETLARLEKDEDLWLFTDLSSPCNWTMTLYGPDTPPQGMELSGDEIKALARGRGVLLRRGRRCLYGEPVNSAGKVVIFGGGHVAQALTPLLLGLGFRCVIFDNRKEFASRDLFPAAFGLITGDYGNIFQRLEIGPGDYIVIATHGCDLTVLRQLVSGGRPCAYAGVIGSKRKIALVKQQLSSEGLGGEILEGLSAPIGLDILSETPEEIAVSIAGEMIRRRAERRELRS